MFTTNTSNTSSSQKGNFYYDLKIGQNAEHEFVEYLISRGASNVSTTSGEGNFSDYDIRYTTSTNREVTVEVKHDIKCKDTGNIAIELFKEIDYTQSKSGLSATKSDFYIYKLGDDTSWYMIKTKVLKALFWQLIGTTGVRLKQYGTTHLLIVPVNIFKLITKELKN